MRFAIVFLASTGLFLLAVLAQAGEGVLAHECDERVGWDRSSPAIGAVFEAMGQVEGFEATFRENRESALTVAPIATKGRVYFARPELFARYTDEPEQTMLVVSRDRVIFHDGVNERVWPRDTRGPVQFVINAMLALARADRDELEQQFHIAIRQRPGLPEYWSLCLSPRETRVLRQVRRIVVDGKREFVERLTFVEAGGRTTVAEYSDYRRRDFDPAQRARLFLLD